MMYAGNQSVGSDKGPSAKEKPGGKSQRDGDEKCRCEEVSKKGPIELLKIMLSDLAFWRKEKGKG